MLYALLFHSLYFHLFVGFIGYAKDVYEIVTHKKIENRGDDQLYYTQIFLDTELRVGTCTLVCWLFWV